MDTLKKTTSEAKLAANRRNAQKSTGPRSEEGKAQSCRNALTHGLTAKQLVLQTEDAEAFEERRQEWHEAYQPAGPAESALLDRAFQSLWRLERCAKAEAARLATRVTHAAGDFEREALDRAEELGRRLIHDPVDINHTFKLDPLDRAAYQQRRTDHPAILKRALEATTQGVDWLIARWEELQHTLTLFGTWHIYQAYVAARLLGRRPEDSTDDPMVAVLILNMLGTQKPNEDHYGMFEAFNRARKLDPSRPVEHARIDILRASGPASADIAQTNLHAIISSEITRLRALKSEYLDALAESDRAAAVTASHFDDSHAAVLLRRYETTHERELRRTLKEVASHSAPLVPLLGGESRGEGVCADCAKKEDPSLQPSPHCAGRRGQKVCQPALEPSRLRNEPKLAPQSDAAHAAIRSARGGFGANAAKNRR